MVKIEYQHTFGLPRNMVWKYVKDEKVLINSISGCRSFTESSQGVYQAEMDIQFGPLKDVLTLEVCLVNEKAPSFYHLKVKGKGKLGEINGTAEINFNDSQGATAMKVVADAQVSGKLAGAAERVLTGGANKGIESFFEKVEKEIKKSIYQMRKRNR